jgi:hypothetical protein
VPWEEISTLPRSTVALSTRLPGPYRLLLMSVVSIPESQSDQ